MRQEIESAAIQNEMESPQGSLRDLLYGFFRRKFLLISSALVILVLGLLGTMSVPVIYKARADILVKPGAGELTSVDSTLLDSKSIIHDDSLMRSEAAILESQPVSAAVVDTLGVEYVLGLGEDTHAHTSKTGWMGKLETIKGKVFARISAYLPSRTTETVPVGSDKLRARAVARVQQGLEIERRDNFITLYYRFSSPEKAQTILGEIIKEYRKRRSQVYAVKPDDFRKETESVHTELVGKENELQKYLSTLNISSLEDDRKLLLEQLSGIESEIQKADVIIGASETQLTALEGLNMDHPNQMIAAQAMTQNPVVQAYTDRLVTLQLSAIELLSKYPRDSQPVRDIEKQISTLQTLIASQIDSGNTESPETAGLVSSSTIDSSNMPNPLLLARISLDSQRTRREILTDQKEVIKKRLSDLASHDLALARLKRDVGVLEKSYLEYCTNLRQAEIQAALNHESISNVSLVQAPTLPGDPNRTIQTLVLAFTLIGALFGSITLVLIFNHMDHSIHTPQDLENRLQLKTLASIPSTAKAEIDGRLKALSAKPVSYFSGLGKSDSIPTPEHAYILGKEIS
jgi:uncharacterized protein involved in exopolysaccharide biosynthesis